jgi:hypothetical protein
MLGERLTRRSPALERLYRLSPVRSLFGNQLVLSRGHFQIFELKLHLLQKPRLALGAAAVKLPAQLLDLKLEIADQCFCAREVRLGIGRFSLRLKTAGALGKEHRMRSGKIGWQRFQRRRHTTTESDSPETAKQNRHPTDVGRHVSCGLRQSMPDRR